MKIHSIQQFKNCGRESWWCVSWNESEKKQTPKDNRNETENEVKCTQRRYKSISRLMMRHVHSSLSACAMTRFSCGNSTLIREMSTEIRYKKEQREKKTGNRKTKEKVNDKKKEKQFIRRLFSVQCIVAFKRSKGKKGTINECL